jgi:hypothetical protein
MVKALVFGTKDWGFESSRGRFIDVLFARLGVVPCGGVEVGVDEEVCFSGVVDGGGGGGGRES